MTFLPLLQSPASQEVLRQLATEMDLDEAAFLELLKATAQRAGMLRRKGLFQSFDAILDRASK